MLRRAPRTKVSGDAIVWIATASLFAMGSFAQAQGLIIREQIGGPTNVLFGRYEFYPPLSPYARPQHGPSLYRNFGYPRLEGRILALPAGMNAPSSPYGVQRFTAGQVVTTGRAPSGSRGTAATVARAPYYPRESHIRASMRRSYRRGN